ncbi:hypothetical protein [Mangrovimonas sp. DI 80]|uniref:hypothetical protein n=1 Tax=Mangrovimonas sp. DI 80 TaxID=1779330 RepID=UPI000975B449|nr:hypothetical protein [Mangrovimonas sp. DI 80]OMP30390.1 hypothetical protein BKM32_13495 [Mangrovimonas sp. DI 80]
MKPEANTWTKTELQVYILLLCANADSHESEAEINLIKSKSSPETFEKMYQEFSSDTEEQRFEKIDDTVQLHHYSNIELAQLRREMYEVFFSDCNFAMMERNLDKIMDNILY